LQSGLGLGEAASGDAFPFAAHGLDLARSLGTGGDALQGVLHLGHGQQPLRLQSRGSLVGGNGGAGGNGGVGAEGGNSSSGAAGAGGSNRGYFQTGISAMMEGEILLEADGAAQGLGLSQSLLGPLFLAHGRAGQPVVGGHNALFQVM